MSIASRGAGGPDRDSIRVTLIDNRDLSEAKVVAIPRGTSLPGLLKLASERLGMKAKKMFLQDGGAVDDVAVLRDNDIVYVSAGEPLSAKAKDDHFVLFSLAVMGPGSVGKSAMTLQYVQNVFVTDYDPTIEDAYRKSASIEGEPCLLDILDTAGQEDYIALRSTWMRQRDGFLLVYSIADKASFDALDSFYEQLCSLHEGSVVPPIVVVGNKCDMEEEREVSLEEGRKLAYTWNALFMECSAKTGHNIEHAFATLAKEVKEFKAKVREPDRASRRWRWCVIL